MQLRKTLRSFRSVFKSSKPNRTDASQLSENSISGTDDPLEPTSNVSKDLTSRRDVAPPPSYLDSIGGGVDEHSISQVPLRNGAKERKRTPWEQAFACLNEGERSTLGYDPRTISEGDSLASAILATKDKILECQEKRWSVTLPSGKVVVVRDSVESILLRAQTYMRIGDIMVQSNPDIAALIWGGVRFLMQAGINDAETFHSIACNLDAVVALCGRGRLYENLYSESSLEGAQRVMAILPQLYESILRFLLKAIQYFSQSTRKRFADGIFKPFSISFRPLLDTIRAHELTLDQEARIAADESQALERRVASERHCALQRKLSSIEMILEDFSGHVPSIKMIDSIDRMVASQEDENRLKILNWLSKYPYLETHRRARKLRQDGTGMWLLRDEVMQAWMEDKNSTTLWIFGAPGTGKTVLSSLIIDTLSLREDSIVIYYYCNYKDALMQNEESIVGALVKQLCTRTPRLPDALIKLYEFHKSLGFASPTADLEELQHALLEVASEGNKKSLTIIIDGMDELLSETRKSLYKVFKSLRENKDCIVKVAIISRWKTDIKNQMSNSAYVLEVSSDKTELDIRAYVDAEVEDAVNSGELLDGEVPDHVLVEVKNALYKGAQGMFLWVRYQIPYICAQDTEFDVLEALESLPTDLTETYARILHTIYAQTSNRVKIAERILRMMLVATRPLSLAEITEVSAIEGGEKSFDSRKVPRGLNPILGACGNLIVYDEQLDIVRFSHFSVHEFLSKHLLSNLETAQAICAEVCLTVLCFDEHGTDSDSKCPTLAVKKYATENWYKHLKATHIRTESLSHILEVFTKKKSIPFDKWLEDISHVSNDFRYQKLWKLNANVKPNALLVAAHLELEDLLENLLLNGYDAHEIGPLGWNHLHTAAGMCSLNAIRKLLSLGVDPTRKDSQGRTPLHIISSIPHQGSSLPTLCHEQAIAASLLVPLSGPDMVDDLRNTPLHAAAQSFNLSIIRTLFIKGARSTACNYLGRTPLQVAILEKPFEFQAKPDVLMHLLALGSPQDTVGGGWLIVSQQLRANNIYEKTRLFLLECGLDVTEKTFGTKPLVKVEVTGRMPMGRVPTNLWHSPRPDWWRVNLIGTRLVFRKRCERWLESGKDFG